MSEEIHETPSTTPNFQTELAAQLAELMPEVIADGKVDVEKLKELLDGDTADTSERFGLFWPGKKRALRAAQEPTTATLRPDFENSKDWDTTKNVFIEGDNLEVLKILQKHYHAKIKMIYIDPPYNTGKDFVYPDNYKEGLATYLEWTKQVNEEGKKLLNQRGHRRALPLQLAQHDVPATQARAEPVDRGWCDFHLHRRLRTGQPEARRERGVRREQLRRIDGLGSRSEERLEIHLVVT